MRSLGLLISCLFIVNIASAQSAAPDHVPGRLIVHHNGDPSSLAAASVFAGHGARVHARLEKLAISVIDVPPAQTDAIMLSLRQNPLFRGVEYDYYAREAAVPNDPDFSSQWHLSKIAAPSAWDVTTGSGIPIAVVDSGVDSTHPDLSSRVMAGWNFVSGNSNTADVDGHGTAVAGTIAAATNNGQGVAGVTWQNPIMPLVVTDSTGYATYSNMAAAIQYAVDHGARVINVSLGGSQSSSVLQSAVDYARNNGALVMAAAMNNSSTTPMYPAACTGAVAVAATDENDNLASFSDYGNWITLSAPGVNILTTDSGGGYGYWYGTSLATPIVTGVAALALAADPALSSQGLLSLMESNADNIGSSYYFGYGRVNAYRTVAAARALVTGSSSSSSSSSPSNSTSTPPPTSTPPSSSSTSVYINAGGKPYTSSSGQAWAADEDYTGGYVYATSSSIGNTSDPVLYQTERYGTSFGYTIPVSSGNYNVTLKFAEWTTFWTGGRTFNVTINGNTVLTNFDIYAQVGGLMALDKTFTVPANGQIAIQFTGTSGNAVVSAIAISPAGQTTTSSARFVQGASAVVVSSGGTVTLQQSVAAGDKIVVALTWSYDPCAPSISDSLGNTYAMVYNPGAFWVFLGTASRSGSDTLSLSASCGNTLSFFALEYSGLSSFDTGAGGISNGGNPCSTGTVNASGTDLTLALFASNITNPYMPGANAVQRAATSDAEIQELVVNAGSASQTATAQTVSFTYPVKGYIVAFK